MAPPDLTEMALRLLGAAVAGALVGLNRDLKGKPAGVRTHGIVALGSALLVLTASMPIDARYFDPGAVSRIMQGIVTGIGFLGAGVILKDASGTGIHGLTTAATVWLTACLGMACGLGAWWHAGGVLVLTFLLLIYGGPLERWVHARLKAQPEEPGE